MRNQIQSVDAATTTRSRSTRRPLETLDENTISSKRALVQSDSQSATETKRRRKQSTLTSRNDASHSETLENNINSSAGLRSSVPKPLLIQIPKGYENPSYQGLSTGYAIHELLIQRSRDNFLTSFGAHQIVPLYSSPQEIPLDPLAKYLWRYDYTNPDLGSRCAYFHHFLQSSRQQLSSVENQLFTTPPPRPLSSGGNSSKIEVSEMLADSLHGIDYELAATISRSNRAMEEVFHQTTLKHAMYKGHQVHRNPSIVKTFEHPDYFKSKIQVLFYDGDRAKLVDSLLHIAKRFYFSSAIIFTAISIMDYYFMKVPNIPKNELLEVGLACMLISYKWERNSGYKFPLRNILIACAIEQEEEREQMRRQIFQRELHIFAKIHMNLQVIPSLWTFLSEYMRVLHPAGNMDEPPTEQDMKYYTLWMKLTGCICERLLLSYEVVKTFVPSKLVCAALTMSNAILLQHQAFHASMESSSSSPYSRSYLSASCDARYPGIPLKLQKHCGYSNQDLDNCIQMIQNLFLDESLDYVCYWMKKWWERFSPWTLIASESNKGTGVKLRNTTVPTSGKEEVSTKSFSYEVFLQFMYQYMHPHEFKEVDAFQHWYHQVQDLRRCYEQEDNRVAALTDETWKLLVVPNEDVQQCLHDYLLNLPQLVEHVVDLRRSTEDFPASGSNLTSAESIRASESSLLTIGDDTSSSLDPATWFQQQQQGSFDETDMSRSSSASCSRRSSISLDSTTSHRKIFFDEIQRKKENDRFTLLTKRINDRMDDILQNDPYDEYEPLRSVRIRYYSIYHEYLVTCPPMV